MIKVPAEFQWLQGPECPLDDIYCVSFFHGLDPADVLRRFDPAGAAGEEMAFERLAERVLAFADSTGGGDGGGHVGVVRAGDWSVAIELWGWQAVLHDVVPALSAGCEFVAVGRHEYAEDGFAYAIDGDLLTWFTPTTPQDRYGTEPDHLLAPMRATGLRPDPPAEDASEQEADWDDLSANGLVRAFWLAAEITGVAFTRDLLDRPLLVGTIAR
ncbi:hypothetical protein Sru01_40270 [Sphaerisporangium rufum]|uniref:Uncharacterized protein n=1 Tax=Sphaerisporangium rufum TaxID=1381558 RepID=A0A919R685_9ACTN|nr:DUF6461 domain-containing protein [Sphaerisporangium rufum]GII79045.1 hypothetical protein Sru01_40270 [Sphaerisporangium rufum]